MSSLDLRSVRDGALLPYDDDGKAAHLRGARMPDCCLVATDGTSLNLSRLKGLTVFYIYPMTSRPDRQPVDGWDEIPGARGCTPQSCSFRDHFKELKALGVTNLYGLSVQDTDYQKEAVERLHLPFPLLSDAAFDLQAALQLPVFEAGGMTLLRRITLILLDDVIDHVFYPVFPPDRNASDVMDFLRNRQSLIGQVS